MSRLVALSLLVFAAACTTNGHRIDHLAESAGLSRNVIEAAGYRSVIYMKDTSAARDAVLFVFLEGDGRPGEGPRPSMDPTTANPIALELLLRTPRPAAYISRPCYQQLQSEGCTPEQWTAARYSKEIVASMAAAVSATARRARARDVVLVGYSGGGTLAVLIAEQLENVAAVITVAANLDTDAWTTQRRFLSLTRSLNPATSAHEHRWPEIHLHGALDAVVPVATTAAYFQRHPAARQRIIDDYDHVCCWVEGWPALLAEIEPTLR